MNIDKIAERVKVRSAVFGDEYKQKDRQRDCSQDAWSCSRILRRQGMVDSATRKAASSSTVEAQQRYR